MFFFLCLCVSPLKTCKQIRLLSVELCWKHTKPGKTKPLKSFLLWNLITANNDVHKPLRLASLFETCFEINVSNIVIETAKCIEENKCNSAVHLNKYLLYSKFIVLFVYKYIHRGNKIFWMTLLLFSDNRTFWVFY